MANEAFDFKAFKKLKYVDYKKQHAKTSVVKKSKAALVLHKYDLGTKKKQTLIIPFKKMDQAVLAYKALKSDKNIHLVKWTSLVKVTPGKGEVTLEIKKGGLTAELIQTELAPLFKGVGPIELELNVTGTSDDAAGDQNDDTVGDQNQDTASDMASNTVVDESTILELKQEFQAAQQLYKESKSLDKAAKVGAIKIVLDKFKILMPKLDNFLESSDKKQQLQTAAKIKENIIKFQTALSENSTPSPSPKASNNNLDALTGGISTKAAQLLKAYQDEISSIDGLADKLKSISQIA